jgi:hypothetical protein
MRDTGFCSGRLARGAARMTLERITAARHHAPTTSGKTRPAIVVCERADRSTVEVVAKFSAGCEQKEISLAREAVAACLAGDLGLPVPQPFIVEVPPDWCKAITDPGPRERVRSSSPLAFGSQLVTGGYSIWHSGVQIDLTMLPTAAAVFVFDLLVQNVDRRADNPNCLVKGSSICIFDHELAFTHGMVLFWKPPWREGSLNDFRTPGKHIFREKLTHLAINYEPIRAAWASLSDQRLAEYEAGIPAEWGGASPAVKSALDLVKGARDNIEHCLQEVKRVLR